MMMMKPEVEMSRQQLLISCLVRIYDANKDICTIFGT